MEVIENDFIVEMPDITKEIIDTIISNNMIAYDIDALGGSLTKNLITTLKFYFYRQFNKKATKLYTPIATNNSLIEDLINTRDYNIEIIPTNELDSNSEMLNYYLNICNATLVGNDQYLCIITDDIDYLGGSF